MGTDPKEAALDTYQQLPQLLVVGRREQLLGVLFQERPQPPAEVSNDELLDILISRESGHIMHVLQELADARFARETKDESLSQEDLR